MTRHALSALALLAVSSCATVSAVSVERRAALEADARPATEALQAARFDDAVARAKEATAKDPHNSRAQGVLALGLFRAAMHDLATDALTVGSSLAASSMMRGNFFNRDYLDFAVKRADERLAEVDAALTRAAEDEGFSLELCLACWEVDWNRNGEVDERDRHLLEIELDSQGEALPPNDPRRRPTFRFDVADVAWLRALVNFQRAGLALLTAYDFDTRQLSERHPEALKIKLRDPKQVARAREFLLAGLGQAQQCRKQILAETDDDREWVPNPHQKSHAMPLEVDQALFDTWAGVLDDVEHLVKSDEGLSVADLAKLGDHPIHDPTLGYIDLGKLLSDPHDFWLPLKEVSRGSQSDADLAKAVLPGLLGSGYQSSMRPSQLPARLERMHREMDTGKDTFERKLRYLLWLN